MDRDRHSFDPNDDIMQLYPSPIADAYYAPEIPRDHIDPSLEDAMDLAKQDPAQGHVAHDHDHRPPQADSAEELRLAAELSSKLGSMIAENAAHNDQDQGQGPAPSDLMSQNHDAHSQNQDGSMKTPDADIEAQFHGLPMQNNLSTSPNHEPAFQHHEPAQQNHVSSSPSHEPTFQHHEAPKQNHAPALQSRDLAIQALAPPRAVTPQNNHQAPHQYIAGALAAHSQVANPVYGGTGNTPPRKRSKVSRACDECRRKKVKCDAGGDVAQDEQCSNCRKAGQQCLFSRVPQKRGPSKGYIKELADRIIFIEGKLGGQTLDPQMLDIGGGARRTPVEELPSALLNDNSKRPFSSVSSDIFNTPIASRLVAWASEQQPPQQSPPAPQSYGRGRLLPKPSEAELPEAPEAPVDAVESLPTGIKDDLHRGIDELTFVGYINLVHPLLPLLPESQVELEAELADCSATLRRAFTEALYAVVHSLTAGPAAAAEGSPKVALCLLAEWETEPGVRSVPSLLMQLRTFILLAIEADTHGPDSLKGQHGGPSRTTLLSRAIMTAYSMNVAEAQRELTDYAEVHLESSDALVMRAWFSLVAMDRWNAVGTGAQVLIPEDSVVFGLGLKAVLGEGAYQFLRLSRILASAASMIKPARSLGSSTPFVGSDIVGSFLTFWLDETPKTVVSTSHPALFLAYWHCRIIGYLLNPAATSADLLKACKELAQLLAISPVPQTPIHHNLAGLAALCLGELTKVDSTREEARTALSKFSEGHFTAPDWDFHLQAKIIDYLRPPTSPGAPELVEDRAGAEPRSEVEVTASEGLRHLADLAVTAAGTGKPAADPFRPRGDYDRLGFDPRPLLTGGYLNAIRASA